MTITDGPFNGVPETDEQVLGFYCGSVILPPLESDVKLIFTEQGGTSNCYLNTADCTFQPQVWAASALTPRPASAWVAEALGTKQYTVPLSPKKHCHLGFRSIGNKKHLVAVTLGKNWVLATNMYWEDGAYTTGDAISVLLPIHTATIVMRGSTPYPAGAQLPMTDDIDKLMEREKDNQPSIPTPNLIPVT